MHEAGMMNRFLDLSSKMAYPVLLLLFALGQLSSGVSLAKTPLVTLEELQSLNASCDGLNTCRGRARGDDDMRFKNCQCGSYCVRYGTCCMEVASFLGEAVGEYRRGLNCSATHGSDGLVHIVEKCPSVWDGDESVRDLCLANAEDNSDIMLLVPVSSLKTGITYRNYFCYVCNTVDEMNDSFISWDVRVRILNLKKEPLSVDLSTLTYDPKRYKWTYPGFPQDLYLSLETEPPAQLLEKFSIYCRYGDVTSTCAADWTDDVTRTKCGFYTALVSMRNEEGDGKTYRNVHCGICNWASTENVQCSYATGYGGGYDGGALVFQEMFRISEALEDQCPEGKIYDPVTKKCRNFRCGKKMEMVKGRCVRKE